ncbi:MAG: type II toxin-antitoxin system RelE/ParE family toxin [Gammaproteobacteria bacterium]
MRIFKTAYFHRLAQNETLPDMHLKHIVQELEQGLFEANLGGNLFKKRIAIGNKGKSGGLRSIIAYKKSDKVIFLYCYAKNVMDNISHKETEAFKKLSKYYLNLDDLSLQKLLKNKELIEVKNE